MKRKPESISDENARAKPVKIMKNIIITIKKKRNFDMSEFIDMEKERYELAELLDLLMAWTADSENNRKFKRLLE